jgi:hypothetical protein
LIVDDFLPGQPRAEQEHSEVDQVLAGCHSRRAGGHRALAAGLQTCGEGPVALGTFKTGKRCLYIDKLSDADPNLLEELVAQSESKHS